MIFAAVLLLAADFDFSVSALSGATVGYRDLRGDKATVVAFLSTRCPISHAYQQRLGRLYEEYKAKGVGFAILNANANESAGETAKFATAARFNFPVYKDYNNRVADLLDAQTTPEFFVLDATGRVRYRGAMDDAATEARVTKHGLRDAVDALLRGEEPVLKDLKAFGCVLKRVRRDP